MSELRERQKQVAIERMKKIGIMEQPIKEFEENGKVNLSENGGLLYWLNDDEQKMVDDFEKENNGLVYHVIKSRTTIGLMYALLYVFNKDMPDCNEFGTIGIEASIGGLIRTW